jgi:glycosyltransferase involved in cell wall biosynthesis
MSTGGRLFALPFLHFGVGRLATDLMLASRASGYQVLALTCGWQGESGDDPALVDECRRAGIHFEHADIFSRDAAQMRAARDIVARLYATWTPDVAHAFTAVAAAALHGVPTVASCVGWSPTKADWQRRMDVEILERCAVVTAVSDAVAGELAAAGLRRAPVIIRNGVRVPVQGREYRDTLQTVGVVAHLIERKGVDVLLDGLSRLNEGCVRRVRIAGTGEAERALRAQAAALEPAISVEWCGHVSLEDFFPTIDLLVLPSRSDALPLVLLEGMAAGLPIVASRVGGIPEALLNGSGWLVEPDDATALANAVADAIAHPTDAHARGQRARARVSADFDQELCLAGYAKCYRQALAAAIDAA